jgi:hypothetical protein
MTWILILWITGDPDSTAVMTQPDKITCNNVQVLWEGISPKHEAYCTYGDIETLTLGDYVEQK